MLKRHNQVGIDSIILKGGSRLIFHTYIELLVTNSYVNPDLKVEYSVLLPFLKRPLKKS